MKPKIIIPIILTVLILAGAGYWYLFMNSGSGTSETDNTTSTQTPNNGFVPFERSPGTNINTPTNPQVGTSTQVERPATQTKIPTLRLLSNTPIGGYTSSTTASTTLVRWIDRGRGDVYEAKLDSLIVDTLSNTILPKVYESLWNKNATAFIGSMFKDKSDSTAVIYAELKVPAIAKSSTSTTSINPNTAPYELKGKSFPDNMLAYAVSPKKDKIFMFINETGTGVGYISNFDGSSLTRIFDTPLTQVTVEWPEDNNIAITTKSSADQDGFLYFVSPKTGLWKKVLGPTLGLTTKVSHDARYVLVTNTSADKGELRTRFYDIVKNTDEEAVIRTISDKCVWGNFYKNMLYCGVPTKLPEGVYPDDWYKGKLSFSDNIWQMNATDGEVRLIFKLSDTLKAGIDTYNFGLDRNDNYLMFMNKNDLSLWSLDLVSNY